MLFLKNLLFTVLVPGTVAVYLPLLLSAGGERPSRPLPGVACALFLTGAAIYCWCLWDFASFGRGTPAPIDAPKRLVVRGLYRYSRNPMYLGVLTTVLGWVVLCRSATLAAYFVGVATLFELFVVLFEEPVLRRFFGSEYVAYSQEVPRWLGRATRTWTTKH